jgi:Protein of unknown function (DUF2281)
MNAIIHQPMAANIEEYAMTAIEVLLIERLKKLPPSRVAEVVDFVEFLASREERGAAAQRLTDGLARLDALKLPTISEDEVEEEIQAARQERHSKQDA